MDDKACKLYTLLKPKTSLAPLSRFRGSRVTTAHETPHPPMLYISELYEDCARSRFEIDYEIDDAWTSIHGSMTSGHVITACKCIRC